MSASTDFSEFSGKKPRHRPGLFCAGCVERPQVKQYGRWHHFNRHRIDGLPDPDNIFARRAMATWWLYFGDIPPSRITATAPVGGEETGAVKAGGSGHTEEGPGYPACRSKLKNQVRNNCPEAQCPEVQCPDCNSGGVMATCECWPSFRRSAVPMVAPLPRSTMLHRTIT